MSDRIEIADIWARAPRAAAAQDDRPAARERARSEQRDATADRAGILASVATGAGVAALTAALVVLLFAGAEGLAAKRDPRGNPSGDNATLALEAELGAR